MNLVENHPAAQREQKPRKPWCDEEDGYYLDSRTTMDDIYERWTPHIDFATRVVVLAILIGVLFLIIA
jgi:hypothetical protein